MEVKRAKRCKLDGDDFICCEENLYIYPLSCFSHYKEEIVKA